MVARRMAVDWYGNVKQRARRRMRQRQEARSHELDHVDAKVLVHHRAEPDARIGQVHQHRLERGIHGPLHMRLHPQLRRLLTERGDSPLVALIAAPADQHEAQALVVRRERRSAPFGQLRVLVQQAAQQPQLRAVVLLGAELRKAHHGEAAAATEWQRREALSVARRVDGAHLGQLRHGPERRQQAPGEQLLDVRPGPAAVHRDAVRGAQRGAVGGSKQPVVHELHGGQYTAGRHAARVGDPGLPALHATQHVGADRRVVHIGADPGLRRDKLDHGQREGVAHRVHKHVRREPADGLLGHEHTAEALAQQRKVAPVVVLHKPPVPDRHKRNRVRLHRDAEPLPAALQNGLLPLIARLRRQVTGVHDAHHRRVVPLVVRNRLVQHSFAAAPRMAKGVEEAHYEPARLGRLADPKALEHLAAPQHLVLPRDLHPGKGRKGKRKCYASQKHQGKAHKGSSRRERERQLAGHRECDEQHRDASHR